MNERYLDAAATAPLRPESLAAMEAVFAGQAANPSSVHSAGYRAAQIVVDARNLTAASFGVRSSEVIFTSGGTEANNLAIIGLALAHPRGRHIVTSPIEHPSVTESCRYLERVFGYDVTTVPVDENGRVDPADVAKALRPDTTLVTIGLANAEVGTVQPLPEIAEIAKSVGALVHTDAVQAAASLPVRIDEHGWPGKEIDALTVASHKFGGPQGVGALILRGGIGIEPLMHGGGQEQGRRSGTSNVAGVAGFAAAVDATVREIGTRALALMESRDLLVKRITQEVAGAIVTGHRGERLPGHASFVFEGVSGESLLVALDAAGIAVSSGSACAAGKSEPSTSLLAMGISPDLALSALRMTLANPISEQVQDRIVTILQREAGASPAR